MVMEKNQIFKRKEWFLLPPNYTLTWFLNIRYKQKLDDKQNCTLCSCMFFFNTRFFKSHALCLKKWETVIVPVPTVSQEFGTFFQTWVIFSDNVLLKMYDIITTHIFTTIFKIIDSLFSAIILINHDKKNLYNIINVEPTSYFLSELIF